MGGTEGNCVGADKGNCVGDGVGLREGAGEGVSEGEAVGSALGTILGNGVGFHTHSSGSLIVDTAHLPSAHSVQKRDVMLPAKKHSAHSSGASMFL